MKTIYRKVDKTQISKMPIFTFNGEIIIVDTEEKAYAAIEALKKEHYIGIDTETRPAFKKGVTHKVALLQLSTEKVCYLFRLNKIGILPEILQLLSNEKIIKIGLALDNDIRTLRKGGNFNCNSFIDLQNTVKEIGVEDQSLQKIFANIFAKHISKRARLSNWENEELSESQQRYAATDAYTCLILYKEINRLKKTQDYTLKPGVCEDIEKDSL